MPDILIRMEMPKNCMACSEPYEPFSMHRKCYVDGHVFCYSYVHGRDKDCPLHELPPHGDLIDRDAYRREMMSWLDWCSKMWITPTETEVWGKLMDALNNAPVIVPAEKGE